MKKRIIAALVILCVLGGAGCQKPSPDSQKAASSTAAPQQASPSFDDVKEKSKEALKALGGFTASKLDALKKDLLVKLDDMDKKVADLQGKANEQGPSVRDQVHEKLKALSAKTKEAREKLTESAVSATTAEAWERVKATADTLLGDLGKTYKDVLDSMKPPAKDSQQQQTPASS